MLGPLLAVFAILFSSHGVNARVIYGEDNRFEVSEGTLMQREAAAATATMIASDRLSYSDNGLVTLNQRSLRDYFNELSYGRATLCEEERFSDQPNPGDCTGFLIASDLLLTAGHCAKKYDFCEEHKWVFGFEYDSNSGTAGVNLSQDNVYSCKKVINHLQSEVLKLDYALVQLDRDVVGRKPMRVRNDGAIESNSPLFVVGSPTGLPLKIADGANVRSNGHPFYFNANLDTFQGSSGSAVFHAKTGIVEGIIVRGEVDYKENKARMCFEVNRCPDNGCRGEEITRITVVPEIGFQAPLIRAIENGDMNILKTILKTNFWVDFYTENKETALMRAASFGNGEAMELLFAKGADVNLQDSNGDTALHRVVRNLSYRTEDTLRVLLKANAQTDIRNKDGKLATELADHRAQLILKKYRLI